MMNIDPIKFECKISVVVAVRNAEATLRKTLQSLVAQTFQDFEIILIDGASTDGTLNVAEEFSSAIKVLVSEPDDGIADAWNKGVGRARGEWIAFANAGDLLHREHFKRAMDALEDAGPNRLILFCDVIKFNARNELTIKIDGQPPSRRSINRGGIGFGHPGSLAAIACFRDVGEFDSRLRIAIDTDWILRCFNAGHGFKKFCSSAYMAEGGVSDRKFYKAMSEFFSCTTRLGLTTPTHATIWSALLPAIRTCLHVYRAVMRRPLRTLKHTLVSVANSIGQLIPIHCVRRAFFSALGFKLGRGSSIGMGFRFYRPGQISIGECSVVNRDCLFDNRATIVVGKNVSIARDVKIFTAGHDPESPFFEMTSASVRIDDHAVIFAGAMVMPGVRIGSGAVVYGGAVVTEDVEPLALVGGVPARILGKRYTPPNYTLNYPYPMAM